MPKLLVLTAICKKNRFLEAVLMHQGHATQVMTLLSHQWTTKALAIASDEEYYNLRKIAVYFPPWGKDQQSAIWMYMIMVHSPWTASFTYINSGLVTVAVI